MATTQSVGKSDAADAACSADGAAVGADWAPIVTGLYVCVWENPSQISYDHVPFVGNVTTAW
jgi:hypothetical protein